MNDFIDNKFIEAGIPENFRPFFVIHTKVLPIACKNVIESLWSAIKAFIPCSRPFAPINIFMATSPFCITIQNLGKLTYEAPPEVINITIGNMIYLDINKINPYSSAFQVAFILEEFVHGILNVADETLAGKIVEYLYPQVQFTDGRYSLRE